jgi:hypothetical protein
MITETITLEVRTFHTPPPEHARGPCLCDQCWRDYLDWRDQHDDLINPAA